MFLKQVCNLAFLSILICFISVQVFSQEKSKPAITFLDYKRVPVDNSTGYSYIESMWKEDSVWRVQIFNFPERNLLEDFYYKDSLRKEKTGVFMAFHTNGAMADSGYYFNNKREGNYFLWYDDGLQKAIYHYKNGLPIDTCVTWNKEGIVIEVSVTDDWGNGISQQLYGSGKLKATGRLYNGQHNGNWQYKREDGSKIMEVEYYKDSIVSTACFDEMGQPQQGPCIFEKPAAFPGGAEGWRRYLTKNLNYPDDALRKNISGTVKIKFHVAKDGALSEFEIVSSPHESLSQEVIRLLKKGPKWEPAIQLNKQVIYRHIQNVTFRLE